MKVRYSDDNGEVLMTGAVEDLAAVPQAAFAASQHFGRAITVRDAEGKPLFKLTPEWLEDE